MRTWFTGIGGSHGPQHEFQVTTRDRFHPIMAGLPDKWMHAKDELYSTLRGPAKNMTILATAYADRPGDSYLFTVRYGKAGLSRYSGREQAIHGSIVIYQRR
jgi:hypothetical protein